MSIQHAVLFAFEPELGTQGEEDMLAQVRAWPEAIGGFEALRIGRAISTERTRGYQYLLFMELADEAALDAYQVHPVHQRFAAWVVDHGGTVLALDYHLDRATVLVPAGAGGAAGARE